MWEKEKDYLETLDRTQQVIIFRVRTGHCRLLSHLYRLRLAHTDECPCGTDSQTPEHILQSCPSHNTLRQENLAISSGPKRETLGTDGVPSTDSRFPGENRTGRLSMALGTQKKKNLRTTIRTLYLRTTIRTLYLRTTT